MKAVRWSQEQLEAYSKRTDQPPMPPLSKKPPMPKPTAAPKSYALGRLKQGAMNKTEAAYAEHLERQRCFGDILWYRFEGVKLRLADATFLTVDFAVMTSDRELEMHEVKGFWQDDARAKMKIAADQYPFRFIAVTAKSRKDGGGWKVEEF